MAIGPADYYRRRGGELLSWQRERQIGRSGTIRDATGRQRRAEISDWRKEETGRASTQSLSRTDTIRKRSAFTFVSDHMMFLFNFSVIT